MSLLISVKVRRQELSQSAEDWDVNGTCTDATCGFRSESLHQHLTVQKGGTAKEPSRQSHKGSRQRNT